VLLAAWECLVFSQTNKKKAKKKPTSRTTLITIKQKKMYTMYILPGTTIKMYVAVLTTYIICKTTISHHI
jgi:hypothetical protein